MATPTPRAFAYALIAAALFLADGCTAAEPPAAAPSTTAVATPDVNLIIQCDAISRTYKQWMRTVTRSLAVIAAAKSGTLAKDITQYEIENIQDDGEKLYDAAKGRDDQPSKKLTVRIAEFRFEAQMLSTENTSGTWTQETYNKVMAAVQPVTDAYVVFYSTCPA